MSLKKPTAVLSTRTTHVYDASRCTVPVHMCALRMWVDNAMDNIPIYGHAEQMSEISQKLKTDYGWIEHEKWA